MSSSLEISAELQILFMNSWTLTPLKLPDFPFDDTSIDKWIAISYDPVRNDIMGCDGSSTGRINYMGLFRVYCYAERRMDCYKLADDVTAFLNGKSLNKNIEVGIAQHSSVVDLDTNLFEMKVSFEVNQN